MRCEEVGGCGNISQLGASPDGPRSPESLNFARPTVPSWFPRCAGSGEKSWELPQPATRQAHQAPGAKVQFSA